MKKVQILIITLVAILTLGCATFAVLYFATDTFKSDKTLFYKYASQIDLKEFIDLESYNNYIKRLENEGHGNEGKVTIDIAQGEESINESIKYTGYSDPVNKKSSYEISINQDNEELLAMNYLRDQDLYGILFKDIVNQYIVVENNNLKEFASKLGAENTDNIPDKIEGNKLSEYLNYEEIKPLADKYLNIIIEAIPEDNYSKIEKEKISLGDKTLEVDGYQIKLKTKDIQSILKKVLESAKKDEQLLNLMKKLNNEDITFEDYQNYIDEILTDTSAEISKEENVDCITITVYKQGKETVKLSLNLPTDENTMHEITLDKTDKGLMLRYIGKREMHSIVERADINNELTDNQNNVLEIDINVTKTSNTKEQESFDFNILQKTNGEETGNYNVTLSRMGEFTSNSVLFNVVIPFTADDGNANIQFTSNTNFSSTPQFEEFTERNHLVINGVAPEQLSNLFTNLGAKISEKLKDEMLILLISEINTTERTNNMDEQSVQLFNNQFTSYEGTKKGEEVKKLINIVDKSNKINIEHPINFLCSEATIESIESSKMYNVSLIKDDEGYIMQITIKEIDEQGGYTPDYFRQTINVTSPEL